MSNPQQSIVVASKEKGVEFVPFGSDEVIKLSLTVIRDYVAIPTKNGKLPDDRECMRFMMLCRGRKLDPFQGDCFLMGYEGREGVNWSLITAHQAFLKRAEVNKEFDGFDSGVIVRDEDGKLVEREGDFLHPGDELLGGWAVVHFKDRKHPMKRRLNLSTFRKSFGRWTEDPAGMIVKCAEADALRSAFPTMLGGLYTDNERPVIEINPAAKAPDFDARTTPARIADRTHEKPSETPATAPEGMRTATTPSNAAPAPASEAGTPEKSTIEPTVGHAPTPPPVGPEQAADAFKPNTAETEALQSLRLLMHKSGVSEAQVMAYCHAADVNMAKAEQKKLSELSDAKLLILGKGWHNILPKIKAAK